MAFRKQCNPFLLLDLSLSRHLMWGTWLPVRSIQCCVPRKNQHIISHAKSLVERNKTFFKFRFDFGTVHNISRSYTRRKKEESGTKPFFKKKTKQRREKTIQVYNIMTLADLAKAANVPEDGIFEILLERDPNMNIHSGKRLNSYLISEVLKELRMNFEMRTFKPKEATKKNKNAFKRPPPEPSEMVPRSPVVTIMGHVDHGKTTLLDSLRQTAVAAGEAGGITQHIGAFQVKVLEKQITFLDTPGHAAFKLMRERGANVTDIVVLVVAADDGIMEQTKESIKYAQNAGVPMIVVINKCDKPDVDIELAKRDILANGIELEEFGGEVQAVAISALKGTNLDALTEAIVTQAELLELKADPTGPVEGVVIESQVDKGKGIVATAIIQRGTLQKGAILVAGTGICRVRALLDNSGKVMQKAGPSIPVEITGWKDTPALGDVLLEVENEKRAREVISWREDQTKSKLLEEEAVIITVQAEKDKKEYYRRKIMKQAMNYKDVMALVAKERAQRPKESARSEDPELCIVIKGDVDGSVEAILDVLATYRSQQCKLNVLRYGVGTISDKDIQLAATFYGSVYGFNMNASLEAMQLAEELAVPIKLHSVIYKMIDDVKDELSNQLPDVEEEISIGEATVLEPFIITERKVKIPVAGCRVDKGQLNSDGFFKLLRNENVIHEGTLYSMKHFQESVPVVKKDMNCGLRFKQPVNIQAGDSIICYEKKLVRPILDWELDF